jgi:hypothetical protein
MMASLRVRASRVARWAAVLPLLAALVGCFGPDEEIFSAGDAQLVPGLEGRYSAVDGALTIFRAPESNDYRFIAVPKDDKPSSGSFRVVKLGAILVIVQAHLDNEPATQFYHLLFNVISSGGRVATLEGLEADAEAAKALARRLDVRIEGSTLVGPRPAIARFLIALGSVPLARGSGAVFSRAE